MNDINDSNKHGADSPNDSARGSDDKERPEQAQKVHVTAYYTTTADKKNFVAERDRTLGQVVEEAYEKLGEARRESDQLFSHDEPRQDLKTHLGLTLAELRERGLFVRDDGHGKLELAIDIDAEPGGASR
jgi:hypothetical protein